MAPKKEIGEASGSIVKRGRGYPPNRSRSLGGPGGGRDGPASLMEEDRRSSSPTRLDSLGGGFWENFPIPKFALILYQQLRSTQWLPQATAEALDGDGPFHFQLHRVGARQGP